MLNSLVALYDSGVPVSTNSYESIQTVTVGSGGSSTVTFSSIPSTYTHLQIRMFTRDTRAVIFDNLLVQANGDTGSNYSFHYIQGDGSSAYSGASSSNTVMILGSSVSANSTANAFAGSIVDILDYKDTNKYKTFRGLTGGDANGSGIMSLFSGLWQNTSAITSLTMIPGDGVFPQYSNFALYGIKA